MKNIIQKAVAVFQELARLNCIAKKKYKNLIAVLFVNQEVIFVSIANYLLPQQATVLMLQYPLKSSLLILLTRGAQDKFHAELQRRHSTCVSRYSQRSQWSHSPDQHMLFTPA